MTEKILGYVLLIAGLFMIICSAFSVYQVFTGKAMPVRIFRLPGIRLDIGKIVASQMPQVSGLPDNIDLSKILPQLAEQQKSTSGTQEIISADMVNIPLNYFMHLMLMGFLLNVGVQIAGLGTKLLRPIVVKLHEADKNGQ
jgi:hypothetical protein